MWRTCITEGACQEQVRAQRGETEGSASIPAGGGKEDASEAGKELGSKAGGYEERCSLWDVLGANTTRPFTRPHA